MKTNGHLLSSMRDILHLQRTEGPLQATAAIQRALQGGTGERGHPIPQALGGVGAASDSGDVRLGANPLVCTKARRAFPGPRVAVANAEERGDFIAKSYANNRGQRDYKVYVPRGHSHEPWPLIVMLHGCTQDADDFSAGTRMNALADQHEFLVAYPIQAQRANPGRCWNWFKPSDQQRDRGEPALIAGVTRDVLASYSIDPTRVYVAGLSAGGAMAAVMIHTYPDLYAAAGIHSGLSYRCAHDLPSALTSMKRGKQAHGSSVVPNKEVGAPRRPLIVFHGDADATVHPSNGEELVREFASSASVLPQEHHRPAGQRPCTRWRLTAVNGVAAEYWVIHGGPHAWAGGSSEGSYTDASGPDASAEMVRFFSANTLQQ
ncbi:MAG: PHB depolymerase family esterase [Sinobacteraceae bacterium]|nr:PHB depolymerase family esterase [Nevskiaceae bacterium]